MSDSPEQDLTPSLVLRLREGDELAGQLLDRLYGPAMLRFAWGYLRSREDAEDAVQEIFAKVLAASSVPASFRVWLYRVARNHCLNLLRSRDRRRDAEPLPSALEPAHDPTGQLSRLVREEQRAEVARALGELPESLREVLRLRYAEELSRLEIAEVLELGESVVKSRLYEGLQKLRAEAERLC